MLCICVWQNARARNATIHLSSSIILHFLFSPTVEWRLARVLSLTHTHTPFRVHLYHIRVVSWSVFWIISACCFVSVRNYFCHFYDGSHDGVQFAVTVRSPRFTSLLRNTVCSDRETRSTFSHTSVLFVLVTLTLLCYIYECYARASGVPNTCT